MILSHRHRFLFIKGRKVAGTSIEILLSQHCGPDDVITPITPIDERQRLGTAGHPRNYSDDPTAERDYVAAVRAGTARPRPPRGRFYNHMPLAEVLAAAGPLPCYDILFCERSPYAKLLSLAGWRRDKQTYVRTGELAGSAEGLAEAVAERIAGGTALKARNIALYRDEAGKVAAPGWRYETLEPALAAFQRRLGVEPLPLGEAKSGVRANGLDPGAVLRPDQIAFVNEAFADEFAAFGYEPLDPH